MDLLIRLAQCMASYHVHWQIIQEQSMTEIDNIFEKKIKDTLAIACWSWENMREREGDNWITQFIQELNYTYNFLTHC